MKPKKVLFITHSSGLNGSERSLYTLVKGLKQNNKIIPIVILPRKGPLLQEVEVLDIEAHILPNFYWFSAKKSYLRRILRILFNFLIVPVLCIKVMKISPSLIYTNSLATPVGAFVSIVLKIPHIWHVREFVAEDFDSCYDLSHKVSMRIVEKSSVQIICNSKAVKNKLEPFIEKSESLKVIYNGFDFETEEYTQPAEKFKNCLNNRKDVEILIIGLISKGKGLEDAIRALAVLIGKGISVKLSIVGTGLQQDLKYFKLLSEELKILKKINFHGFVNDVTPYYKKATISLICSRCEAFGRTAVESLASGTPVIGTNSGGLPEIVKDRVTGLLYEPCDYKSLADKIETLISNKELYLKYAVAGQLYVLEEFNAERYVLEIQNTIETIIGR